MDTALGRASASCMLGLLCRDRSGRGQLSMPPPGQPEPPDLQPLKSCRRQTLRTHSAMALWRVPYTAFIKSLKVGIIVLIQVGKLRLKRVKGLKVMQLVRTEGDFQSRWTVMLSCYDLKPSVCLRLP